MNTAYCNLYTIRLGPARYYYYGRPME